MAGETKVKYTDKQAALQKSMAKTSADLGVDPIKVIDFAGNSDNVPPGQSGIFPNDSGNHQGGGNNGNGGGNGGSTTDPTSPTDPKLTEKFIFFYHPDHLGSSSYISDANGEVSQHMEYFAFGETFLEEHSNTSYTPYLFNGKELDDETGLYYYGARYYDAKTSVWQSVDPLAEKYPNASPYAYCLNNPINAIDPDGRIVIFINGQHTGDGGNSSYWNGRDTMIMDRIGDHNARYYDGAIGGWNNTVTRTVFASTSFLTSLRTLNLFSSARQRAGKEMGYSQAKEIFGNLADGETIKMAAHSMGPAYAKGFVKGLNKYAKENGIDMKGKIEFEVDFANYQASGQQAVVNPTVNLAHGGDNLAGSSPMPGAKNKVTRQDQNPPFYDMSEHSISSFSKQEINTYVPQSSHNGAGNSKWEEKPKN